MNKSEPPQAAGWVRRWSARAALMLFGTGIAFLAAEGMLRLLEQHPEKSYLALTRAFGTALVIEDDGRHHRLKPGAEVTVGGIHYRTDARGNRVAPGEAAPDSSRIRMAFGDSVTMGWGVPAADAWPARLTPVAMNGGVLGYGIEEVVASIAEYLETPWQRPQQILVGYYPNDPESAAVNAQAARPSDWRVIRLWRRMVGGDGPTAVERYRRLHAPGTSDWELVQRSIRRLAALDGPRVEIVLVLLPALEAYREDGSYALVDVHRRVKLEAEAVGLRVIDLGELPSSFPDGPRGHWVAADDPHPDARAHGAYADAINRALR